MVAVRLIALRFSPQPATLSTWEGPRLSVASWNIGFEPVSSRIDELIQGVRALDADVFVLIEFTPDSDLKVLEDALRQSGLPYTGTVYQSRQKQNLAFFIRDGIKVTRAQVWSELQLGNPDHRPAVALNLQAGHFDFTLVAVHLKSKRKSEGDPDAIRTAQLKLLRNRIRRSLQGQEQDLVLLGDYNMIPTEDAAQFELLNQGIGLDFLQMSLPPGATSHLNASGEPDSLLDGIALSPSAHQEYTPHSFEILPLDLSFRRGRAWFRKNVSDHLPLRLSFDTTVDHDP